MAPVGQLSQPFLEPDRVPKPTDRDKDVATIRAWVNTQTHLPPLTGEPAAERDPYYYFSITFFKRVVVIASKNCY